MDNKIIIAIVAAVIVVAAGVGGAFYFLKGGSDSYDVDVVSEDLKVGDKINYHFSMDQSEKETVTESKAVFLGPLDERSGASFSQEVIQYKNTNVNCDVYQFTVGGCNKMTWNHPTSGFVIKKIETEDGVQTTYELIDTSFDIELGVLSQTVSVGSFYKYNVSDITDYGIMNSVSETRVTAVNDPNVTVDHSLSGHLEQNFNKEIESIPAENQYILKGGSTPLTKADVLSNILYSSFIKNASDKGMTITYGEKKSDVINTVNGLRDVTIEEISFVHDGLTDHNVVYYGKEGMIYKIEVNSGPDSDSMVGVLEFVSSNLVSKK